MYYTYYIIHLVYLLNCTYNKFTICIVFSLITISYFILHTNAQKMNIVKFSMVFSKKINLIPKIRTELLKKELETIDPAHSKFYWQLDFSRRGWGAQPIPRMEWPSRTASCSTLNHFLNPRRVGWGTCISPSQ